MAEEQKFPTEVIDLPSEGKLYPKDSPLSSGKIEVKYMTAREEDILTSQNLIKKGVVIEKLLDSLIVTKGIKCDDLFLGDKNAVMVAARVLAYGPEYEAEINLPDLGNISHTFNLTDCPFKKLPDNINSNEIEIELPVSKAKIVFKLLTSKDEKLIDKEIKSYEKINQQVKRELTTRLKHIIVSVNGDDDKITINNFVDNMLSRDSLHLRSYIAEISPDIELKQEIEVEGDMVEVNIPLTVNFFWPNTTT
jgi:hypothetical protein